MTKEQIQDKIDNDQDFFKGQTFFRHFPGYGRFLGKITDIGINKWQAGYSDGDTDTLDKADMRKYFIDKADDPDDGISAASMSFDNGIDLYTTSGCESLRTVANALDIEPRRTAQYAGWLRARGHDHHGGESDTIPAGKTYSAPHGQHWRDMCHRADTHDGQPIDIENRDINVIMFACLLSVEARSKIFNEILQGGKLDEYKDDTGVVTDPKDWTGCEHRPGKAMWKEAQTIEVDAQGQHGTFEHDVTEQDLRKRGLLDDRKKPVKTEMLYELRWSPLMDYVKHKARNVVKGHKYNMQQGVHYNQTHAPTPQPVTVRLIYLIVLAFNFVLDAWDYSTAFLNADLPPEEQIACSYPRELQRYKNGKPTFLVLKRNCYGIPQTSRRWHKHRTKILMKRFNKDGWKCKVSDEDYCLYIFTSPGGTHSYVSVWTDDSLGAFATVEDRDFIKSETKKLFKITDSNPRHHLLVLATFTNHGPYRSVTFTQTDYIEEMYAHFAKHIRRDNYVSPSPTRTRRGNSGCSR